MNYLMSMKNIFVKEMIKIILDCNYSNHIDIVKGVTLLCTIRDNHEVLM